MNFPAPHGFLSKAGSGGIDQYTVLMLHFDGSLVDSSFNPHTVTGPGGVTPSTSFSKFGGSAAFFPTSSAIQSPFSNDWEFGAGDFTVDWWELRTTSAAGPCAYSREPGLVGQLIKLGLGYCDGTRLRAYSYSVAAWDVMNGLDMGLVQQGAWAHYAVSRQGTTFRTFQNGNQMDTGTSSLAIASSSDKLSIGQAQAGPTFEGYMDEMRVSKGIARWTSSFTPPVRAYS